MTTSTLHRDYLVSLIQELSDEEMVSAIKFLMGGNVKESKTAPKKDIRRQRDPNQAERDEVKRIMLILTANNTKSADGGDVHNYAKDHGSPIFPGADDTEELRLIRRAISKSIGGVYTKAGSKFIMASSAKHLRSVG